MTFTPFPNATAITAKDGFPTPGTVGYFLQYDQTPASSLIGRQSGNGSGPLDYIILGLGLSMDGTTLHSLGGDVVGPASAVDADLAAFDGLTGRLLKDSGVPLSWFTQSLTMSDTPTFASVTADNDVSTGTATFLVSNGAASGFLRTYGSAFAVASLQSKTAVAAIGSVGLVLIGDPAASGGSGSISLRGAGYDSAAETLLMNLAGSRFFGAVAIGQAPSATSVLAITGLPTSAAGLSAGDVWNNGGVLTIV